MGTTQEDCQSAVEREIARLVEAASELGKSDRYVGKRGGTRISEPLQLEVTTDPSGDSALWYVSMHNVGPGGCAFWSRRDLPLEDQVYVRESSDEPNGCWIPGKVIHQTLGIKGHLIGVKFETKRPA